VLGWRIEVLEVRRDGDGPDVLVVKLREDGGEVRQVEISAGELAAMVRERRFDGKAAPPLTQDDPREARDPDE
jgi:hypothetical protein